MLLDTGRVAALGVACTWLPGRPALAAVRRQLAGLLASA
jgi:hypothetical protein